ncbi:MAG: tRNA epoxyqueuosine(34) reductase QueG [Alphaproteobacteria bacterium]|nr:tRNA epoxyqueuosine(34) reductase QueG [Alphaproteobacteria bacterium]
MADPGNATDLIRDQALALDFDAVGFAPAELGSQARDGLRAFLQDGRQGDMGWLADQAERREHPRALWPEARSVVALGLSYGPATDPLARLDHGKVGAISVYAQGRDYHDVLKKRLRVLARWMHETLACEVKLFVDTAPVMEKPLAQAAGLGWQGKHTNLVSRAHGSWLFLGEIYTDLSLAPSRPDGGHEDLCGTCRRCQDICPTRALDEAYKIEARRCISYLTIEHRGPIDRDLRPLMGNRIYGCDDCLAVCPWNRFAPASRTADLLPRVELTAPRLAELARLTDTSFRALFSGSPIKRLGRDRFVRNVLIAIGNSGAPDLAPVATSLIEDAAPVVRGAAIWAARRLVKEQSFQKLKARYEGCEQDGQVLAEWQAD